MTYLIYLFATIGWLGLGIYYASLMEYLIHKYVLHEMGRSPRSFFSFHWMNHHRAAVLNDFRDPDYDEPSLRWGALTKEASMLMLLTGSHAPLFLLPAMGWPGFFAFPIIVCSWPILYFMFHFTMHRKPSMAKKFFPWHYDHHMKKDQDKNFGVLLPIWDHIFGTAK